MAQPDFEETYEIERILAEILRDGQIQYLVKWLGYPDEQCTWEPYDNFTSHISIQEWEKQKESGLGLPDDVLAEVQQRMNDFQEHNHHSGESTVQERPDNHPQIENSKALIMRRQKQVYDSSPTTKTRTTGTVDGISHERDTTTKAKTIQVIRRKSVMEAGTSSTAKQLSSSNQAEKIFRPSLASKPGQRFRNLKHMNNYRKKNRSEPAPSIPPEKLKSLADFEIGKTTAHILPLSLGVGSPHRDESPLFFPDTSENLQARCTSPMQIDTVVFPPARVDHHMDVDIAAGGNSEGSKSIDVDVHNINTTEIEHALEATEDYPRARIPPKSDLIHAANGRWWYRGDIICYFMMGKPIGDATIVDAPFEGCGSCLVALKKERGSKALILEFEPHGFNRVEFELAFRNCNDRPLAIGVINNFKDTAQSFDEFAEHLETNDAVGVFRFDNPNVDISLLLYSCRSASWHYLGQKPARFGRSRLHIAFLPKLVTRIQRPKDISTRQDVGERRSEPPQQRILPTTRQQDKLPSASHRVENKDAREHKSPVLPATNLDAHKGLPQTPTVLYTSRGSTPLTLTPSSPDEVQPGTRDPRLRRASSFTDQEVKSDIKQLRRSTRMSKGWSKLDYKSLVSPTSLNARLRLDPQKVRFFISFHEACLEDATAVQGWLEKHVQSSNVYLDSQRHDWIRFKENAQDTMSVLLFHTKHWNFHTLSGLGTILFGDAPACMLLDIDSSAYSKTGNWSAMMKQLFPRNAMYLVTETMITDHLEDTLAVIRYFDANKKPSYRMVMRPSIERWLLEYSSKERDETRQGKLIDLLALIRHLRLESSVEADKRMDLPFAIGSPDSATDSVLATSYIVSPSTIPGYDEVEFLASATQQPISEVIRRRDDVLKSFYYSYTATRVEKCRRFFVFYSKNETEQHLTEMKRKEIAKEFDCGHVMFWELEKFVSKFCRLADKKKH